MDKQVVQGAERPSLKHLFAFTRWQHGAAISAAVASTIATGAMKTALAVVLGKIFEVVAAFGTAELDNRETLSQVSTWSLVLCGMGGGVWLANAAFMAAWITFGELQAKSVRNTVFESLLMKEMAWYDTQSNGIASLLVSIETSVLPAPSSICLPLTCLHTDKPANSRRPPPKSLATSHATS